MGKNIINIDTKPLSDVINNLIDKLASAVGWIVQPHGHKKDLEDAMEMLKRKLEDDNTLSMEVKVYMVSSYRQRLIHYRNQERAIYNSFDMLNINATPQMINDDWLLKFMDCCKTTSDQYMQAIWGKILACECNEIGSIPTQLIYILSIISSENARMFTQMCDCVLTMQKSNNKILHSLTIFWDEEELLFEAIGINYGKILELETIGLINTEWTQGFHIRTSDIDIESVYYQDRKIEINSTQDTIPVGNVAFTDAGAALYQIINSKFNNKFYEYIVKRYSD